MFRFQILSDLHLELSKVLRYLNLKPTAPYLFLAGDIGNLSSIVSETNLKLFFDHVSQNWKRAFYVTGNHEYYHSSKTKDLLDHQYNEILEEYPNIDFLNLKDQPVQLEFDDFKVQILGRTLWSKPETTNSFNDFNMIHTAGLTTISDGLVQLNEFHRWNQIETDFLKEQLELDLPPKTKRIVMTHFLPLTNNFIPDSKYGYNPKWSDYFGNQLLDLLYLSDLWITGHTHEAFDIKTDYYRWIGNPIGYSWEKYGGDPETVFQL